jgi:hypothetical protein
MADERDPKVSQRYRELPGEEPSRELDQHILAAAHRATGHSHAPLVAPAGRHRWYFSLAAAAVLVFAVAITLHVERQQPDPEAVSTPPAPEAPMRDAANELAKKSEPAAPPPVTQERRVAPQPPPRFTPEPPPQPSSPADAVGAASVPPASAPASRQEAEAAAARAQEANRMRESARQDAQAERRAESRAAPSVAARSAPASASGQLGSVLAERAADTPEGELERIARLRRDGRHEEADKALAEFRKRYPDYRISAEVRAKVERAVPAAR